VRDQPLARSAGSGASAPRPAHGRWSGSGRGPRRSACARGASGRSSTTRRARGGSERRARAPTQRFSRRSSAASSASSQGQVPLAPEVVEAGAEPRVVPALRVERHVVPVERVRGQVGDDAGRLEHDRRARGGDRQAQVEVLARREHRRVGAADPLEHRAPREHAVVLDELGGRARPRGLELVGVATLAVDALLDHARAVGRELDVARAPRAVDAAPLGRALEGQRADQARARLVRAAHERVEPARRDDHVVVDEDDVGRRHAPQAEDAGVVRRQVALRAQQAEAVAPRPRLGVPAHGPRRAAVDVDEPERRIGRREQHVERLARRAETLARHHDHRGSGGGRAAHRAMVSMESSPPSPSPPSSRPCPPPSRSPPRVPRARRPGGARGCSRP